MKSIQTKIIVLIMLVVILCSSIVGGIGIFHSKTVSDRNSAQIMNLICQEEGKRLDQMFYSIEQSVKIIAHSSINNVDMIHVLKSDVLRKLYIETLQTIVLTAANSTEGAVAAYVHLNPEFAPADSGVFYSKTVLNESFHKQKVTDFSKIDAEEMEQLDWYYRPVEKKQAVWLEPYNNGKAKENVISYVMPIYQKEELIGVAGMDILFSDISAKVKQVKTYDTGYAYLTDGDNHILYHPYEETEFPVKDLQVWETYVEQKQGNQERGHVFEYQEEGKAYKLTTYKLENNMRLMLTASKDEIDAQRNALINSILVSTFVISGFCILIAVVISQSIIQPLKELTAVSKQIAEGNLNVTLVNKSQDEVGELSASLQLTVDCLRVYMDRMSDLAYTDALTGVKSKAAYKEEIRKIEKNIQQGFHQFGIVMFDVNGLKWINDTYGHDAGDTYIKGACRLICTTFKHSPVFRIGGDEFVAILTGQDLLKAGKLLEKFYIRMEEITNIAERPEEKVSVAAGMAIFKEGQDFEYQDVFKRADQNMYVNKKALKEGKKPILKIETVELS